MKPKNILIVTEVVYPFSKGGREKRLYDITQMLVKEGHRVDIYTMKWWDGEDVMEHEGVYMHALCRNYRLYVGKRRSIRQGILFGLACTKLIKTRFDIIDVDQIPFFPLYSIWLVCLLKRKKMHATWHEVWGKTYWRKYLGWRGAVATVIESGAVKLPSRIVAVSELTAYQLDTLLNRTKGVRVIPNSVDFNKLSAIKPSTEHNDIIFAARLLEHKHADLLIKSVARLAARNPDISCLIIGTGPEEVSLKQLASKLHVEQSVHFRDFYENIDDLYALIKSSKVYVLPSEREGFGLGLLEANAFGIPAITLDVPHNAARSLIQNNVNGSLVKPNVAALSHAIEYWLTHPAKNTKKAVAQYDSKLMVTKLLEAYAT